ncbi:MAG: hypothetical protein NTU43_12520 [Bacteroidetes bacterium]|nr:hypothetical protein [Bacteroidota bacterium]
MSEIILDDHQENYLQLAKKMISNGLSHQAVLTEIKSKGVDEVVLSTLDKKLKTQQKIRLGSKLLFLGVVLCFSSCLISLGLDFSNPYCNYALYGLTSIGAAVALFALALVFG